MSFFNLEFKILSSTNIRQTSNSSVKKFQLHWVKMFAVKCKYHNTKKSWRITRKKCSIKITNRLHIIHRLSESKHVHSSVHSRISSLFNCRYYHRQRQLYRRWPMKLLERQKSNQFYIDKHPSTFSTDCRHPSDSIDSQVKNIIRSISHWQPIFYLKRTKNMKNFSWTTFYPNMKSSQS